MAALPRTVFLVQDRDMKFACLFLLFFGLLIGQAWADTAERDFIVREKRYTRLCSTKTILTVNGKFPGETIYARKGDTVIVRVHNKAKDNVTIHWHGLSQPRNPWSDGPEYITQCPIQPGSNFTYRLFFSEEEGTIWWHAHTDWDRATVHGAIVVHPRKGTIYPYRKPYKEIPIILGEWWKANVRDVIAQSIQTGAGANISDAFTINGQPGDLYPCSNQSTFTFKVKHSKTYLLRVINAAITTEFFFAIAGHHLTVVGNDASYTKPYTTDFIMITPGQTFDLLVKADSTTGGRCYIAARPYSSTVGIPFDNTMTTAVLEYTVSTNAPAFPFLPDFKNTSAAAQFVAGVRSLATKAHPVDVPQTIDERILITVSVNLLSCEPGRNCSGPNGDRLSASLNNLSFVTPTTDVLEAYYKNISGVFGSGFPGQPPLFFNFTGENLPGFLLFPKRATEVRVVEFNTNFEIVFQGTNLLARENHPMHLHGYSFYVVGMGFGNFDKDKDPLNYNLVDPPYKNTVGVPRSGWAAIRFKTQNPGVWFMHCHLDQHMVWGMNTVFIVKNGNRPEEGLLPPPLDMPRC